MNRTERKKFQKLFAAQIARVTVDGRPMSMSRIRAHGYRAAGLRCGSRKVLRAWETERLRLQGVIAESLPKMHDRSAVRRVSGKAFGALRHMV